MGHKLYHQATSLSIFLIFTYEVTRFANSIDSFKRLHMFQEYFYIGFLTNYGDKFSITLGSKDGCILLSY